MVFGNAPDKRVHNARHERPVSCPVEVGNFLTDRPVFCEDTSVGIFGLFAFSFKVLSMRQVITELIDLSKPKLRNFLKTEDIRLIRKRVRDKLHDPFICRPHVPGNNSHRYM